MNKKTVVYKPVINLGKFTGKSTTDFLGITSGEIHNIYINKILNVEVIALICGQKKGQSLSCKIFPKIGFKATIVF